MKNLDNSQLWEIYSSEIDGNENRDSDGEFDWSRTGQTVGIL